MDEKITVKVRHYLEERPGTPIPIAGIISDLELTRNQVAGLLTRLIRDPRSGITAEGRGMYMFDPAGRDAGRAPGKNPDFAYVGLSADGHRLYADKKAGTVYAMVPVRTAAASVEPVFTTRCISCGQEWQAKGHDSSTCTCKAANRNWVVSNGPAVVGTYKGAAAMAGSAKVEG